MKNISIKILFALIVLISASCTKGFLDINNDPNNPTVVSNGQLLTSSQLFIMNGLGSGSAGVSNACNVFVHQTTQRSRNDSYAFAPGDLSVQGAWESLYAGGIQNLNLIIKNATEGGNAHYVGVAQILKAVTFSYMVDVWGNVPFSESGDINKNPFPKFDNGETIYPELIKLLDEGIANLTKPSNVRIGGDDLIYGGNLVRWRKLAKTWKLKMYNQIRLVQNVSASVNALIAENDFIGSGENFELRYGNIAVPENRNPVFRSDYNADPNTGRLNYISAYFHEILLGTSQLNPILNGIADPRIPYYYFNQLSNVRPNAQNPIEYRNGNFLSIYFASQGPNQGFDQSSSMTIVGLYFCGGRYDDGNGVTAAGVNGNSARGDGALRILPFHNYLYTRAELAQAGAGQGDARGLLRDAILASFAEVNRAAATAGSPAIAATAINTYVDAVMTKYDAASSEGKLELIMTEKWIANFGFGLESYNDYRRTGFPKMFDPNTDAIAFTNNNRGYPVSFPYAQSEMNLNSNAPAQRVVAQDKVFWDR
jgi:hypothetical protein